jgi:phosphonate transport system ATP-binding protein
LVPKDKQKKNYVRKTYRGSEGMNGSMESSNDFNLLSRRSDRVASSMKKVMKYCGVQHRPSKSKIESVSFSEGDFPGNCTSESKTCLSARNVTLGYGKKVVLNDIHLDVARGEFISIIGPSGVGKSTLLMAMNGNVKIFRGDLVVLNHNLRTIKNGDLKQIRSLIGAIYQGYNLVKRLSVLDNIAAGMLRRMSPFSAAIKYYTHDQYEQIYEYMQAVGIEQEALQRCDRLSGGQMQRVAIARALSQNPEIILADEPISSLDPVSARNVMDTLARINSQYGITIIANLHQLDYAKDYCTRIIGINSGKIVYDGKPECIGQGVINQIYQDVRYEERQLLVDPETYPAAPVAVHNA